MNKLGETLSLICVCICAIVGVGFVGAGFMYEPPIEEAEVVEETEPDVPDSCDEQLKQIVKALHAYHDEYETFPPAFVADAEGKPMHSWRVLILPQLGEQELYDAYKFDQPWDGPDNSQLLERRPAVYLCPEEDFAGTSTTSYAAVVGETSAWRGSEPTKRTKMKDDPAQSILLVQATQSEFPWLSPKDIEFEKLGITFTSREKKEQSVTNAKGEGGLAVTLDGTVLTIAADISRGALRNLLDVNDGLPRPKEVEETKTGKSDAKTGKTDAKTDAKSDKTDAKTEAKKAT